MLESDQIILREFSDRVRGIFPDARIWAFGSRVYESASADSDFDLCVVVNDEFHDAEQVIREIAWEIGFAHDVVLSPLCYREQEFTQAPRNATVLVKTILAEGIAA